MRTRVTQSLLVLAFVAGTGCSSGAAGDAQPGELTLNMDRVIVFKDGYALFVKRAVGTTDADGQLYTDSVPDSAILGSFWAVPRNGRLLSMTAGEEKVETREAKESLCLRNIDLLQANRGKNCTVWLSDKTELTGTIFEVLAEQKETRLPTAPHVHVNVLSSRSATAAGSTNATVTVPVLSGSLFVLRTGTGDVTIPVEQVQRLSVADMTLRHAREEKTVETQKRLRFQFEKAGRKQEMLLFHFGPGVRWIPTYRIELAAGKNREKEARIALQAEIINEAEDLADVPFHLVVGVPNFRFKDTVSPLSLERTLRNALRQAAPQVMAQISNTFSNAMMTQRVSPDMERSRARRGAGALRLPSELAADKNQDLFVYTSAALTLRKGQRAAIPLFTATAPYRDVYTWNLHVQRHGIDTAPSGAASASPLVLSKNEVWHQVDITNNTEVPWTTGPALIMQDLQPLAQELLTYTPPGAQLRLPVTVAVDIHGAFTEEETGRKLKALHWDHHQYALVSKRGTLKLASFKSLPAACEVTCRMGGKVTSASNDGQVRLSPYQAGDWKQYRGSGAVNNHSEVTWRFDLKPDESAERTVDYEYYVRH